MIENIASTPEEIKNQLLAMQRKTGVCVICSGYGEKAGVIAIPSDHPRAEECGIPQDKQAIIFYYTCKHCKNKNQKIITAILDQMKVRKLMKY